MRLLCLIRMKNMIGIKFIKKAFLLLTISLMVSFTITGCEDHLEDPINNEINYPNPEVVTKMYITINGNKIEVELLQNSSVEALVDRLKKGEITYTANDYGGFEKVGNLGFSLPTSNTEITTQPGDVILYAGNQIVLFYGSNTWSYTRLGQIKGYSVSELSSLLGAGEGSIQVTISLN